VKNQVYYILDVFVAIMYISIYFIWSHIDISM